MTQEEKFKEAKRLYETANADQKYVLESLFPELKESEDERIVKELLTFFRESIHGGHILTNKEYDSWIAWLEKQGGHAKFINGIQVGDKVTRNEDGVLVNLSQLNRVAKKLGEQKPADKVEPKFKIGDFIVNDYCMGRIVEITNDAYLLDTEQGIPFSSHSIRLWDITKDAKDGDVLVASDKSLFIYDGSINENGSAGFHIAFTEDMDIILNSDDGCGWEEKDSCHPATKEQRNTLFTKMKEAGYEWDAENKKLKKISQRMILAEAKEAMYDKPAWSEEDETTRNALINLVEMYYGGCIDKSEKNRLLNFLKSLRPQNHWKPSDEQIIAINTAINVIGKGTLNGKELIELQEQLKKLKEESNHGI